jgi:hypothetical protein
MLAREHFEIAKRKSFKSWMRKAKKSFIWKRESRSQSRP